MVVNVWARNICKYITDINTTEEKCLKWGCCYYNLTCFFKGIEEECYHFEEI